MKTQTKERAVSSTHKTFLDYLIYVFSVATPLLEIPQAWEIYVHHDAHNVSIYTWGFFLVDNVVWMVYAARVKSWPLLLTSSLYLVMEIIIVIGIFRYQ